MKPAAVLLTVVFFLLLLAQFGGRLPARRALLWTISSALLVVAAWRPALLAPLVHGLGIELVSNFLLAAMVLFLFLQMAEQQVETAELRRALIQHTVTAAARQVAPGVPVQALVVLPCRNEAASLPALIPALRRLETADAIGWVVVDDASDDGSAELLARILGLLQPRMHAVFDQTALELRRSAQNMQQKAAGRIGMGSIEILGDGQEPDAVTLERLDVVEAIDQRTAEAVELADGHGFELACSGVLHQPVQSRARLLGTAHLVFVDSGQLPAAISQILLQFAVLQGGILLVGADSDV